jgi:Domain of unknown function (DU1801)
MNFTPFGSQEVAAKYKAYPPVVRRKLMVLRELVFNTASATAGVGRLQETLKWGEPAYVTAESRSGSTVRIDWKRKDPDRCAIYFHCQTNLVDTFRALFPHDLEFEGNRALLVALTGQVNKAALSYCVAAALTYHLKSRQRTSNVSFAGINSA